MHNERHTAIYILIEINQKGAYNNIALRKALDERSNWKPHQKAFVTELVNGTLRNQILIDYIINNFSRKPVSKMKPFIRELLRTAVYQICWMNKVPFSAAVNEAVKLARSQGFGTLSGFVNGILRNIVRSQESDTLPQPTSETTKSEAEYLSLKYSFHLWLAKSLVNLLGKDAEDFCAQSHIPPKVTICANPLKTTRDSLMTELESAGIECAKSETTEACLYLKKVSDITDTTAYKQGLFFVIDEGAYLAALALKAKPGQMIIDLCAAPGGKSFACAGLMENNGQIISLDIHSHKIRLMKTMAARLGIECITAENRDASVINHEWDKQADAVLLDAPCSGFGIIRRKPDIKYTKTKEDVKTLAEFQRKLLSAGASYVKPGGALVYSTCTITKEENDDNVSWFLDNFPFVADGESQLLLPTNNRDGFFIARMIRV